MWMLLVPLRGSDCVFSPYQHGCHGQGTVKKKTHCSRSGNFAKGQGKSLFLSKSVKNQRILRYRLCHAFKMP